MSTIRLTCPNCHAQYDVPLEVIPDAGRDVQCSNCDHVWFQSYPEPAPVEAASTAADNDIDVVADLESDTEIAPENGQGADPLLEFVSQPKRELDPAVAEVLREEAELEMSKRRKDQDAFDQIALHPMPDLDVTSALASKDADQDSKPQPPQFRRDLLPDVEEVEETLVHDDSETPPSKSSTALTVDPTPTTNGETPAFARGVAVAVILTVLALVVYVETPRLIDILPQAEPALTAYAAWIDAARFALDRAFHAVMTTVSGILNS